MQLIKGGKDEPGFVCPWCAFKAMTRADLDAHWMTDPRCKANRAVSNATQSKYGRADAIEVVAGVATLNRVRAPGCDHPIGMRQNLKDLDDEVIGTICMNCYSEFELEPSTE